MQNIFDDMYRLTGVIGTIFDNHYSLIVSQSGNQNVCSTYHRCNPDSYKNCVESDTEIFKKIKSTKKPVIHRCANGLFDAAYPIYINHTYYGAVMSGQVFNEKPDMEFYREMAEKYGYDMESYFQTIKEVPVIPEDRLLAVIDFYGQLAVMIANLGMARLKEKEKKNILKKKVEERTKELKRLNAELLDFTYISSA